MTRLSVLFRSCFMALALIASATGHAQTFDVVETFGTIPDIGYGPYDLSFVGSFTYNPNGTGFCSAPLCAPGIIPGFTNVSMSGTSGAPGPPPWGPSVPGQIALVENGNALTFYNSDGFPFNSTEISYLQLILDAPLGSTASVAISGGEYSWDGGKSVNHGVVLCNATASCSGRVTVPEPTTLPLCILGLVGVGFMRRRGAVRQQNSF
jgi:hypothetical protein